jgi:hypothetical protein
MEKSRAVHDGRVYFTVGAAAKFLGTTATKVKEMMSCGDLEWTQFRVNGRVYISASSVDSYLRRKNAAGRK